MKVKLNIINMRCIIMSEEVTVPSLIMMTSPVFEESLARDTHTHTHTLRVVYAKIFSRFESKKKNL